MKSCRGSSELIFVVLNFVTPEARYANDVNNRLKIRGWKNSWVENFVTRGIVTKITKISTPRKLPAIRYVVLYVLSFIASNNLNYYRRYNYPACVCVCVCVCVSFRSFLPLRASISRNIGTYVFTATRKTLSKWLEDRYRLRNSRA